MYVKFKLGFPFLNRAKAELGVAYGRLTDLYFQSTGMALANANFDRSTYDIFAGSLSIERNTLDAKQYPIRGRKQFLTATYATGIEKYKPGNFTPEVPFENQAHSWLQIKGHWTHYNRINNKFNLGYMAELLISSKNLMSNYSASILQATAFAPTPHSGIVFNEDSRANQYAAVGVTPVWKISRLLHMRADMYCFAPFYKIKKDRQVIDGRVFYTPYYSAFMDSFEFMGETSLVLQLPFVSIGLYANGYSSPSKNFNVGLNIGYLIFNPKMLN